MPNLVIIGAPKCGTTSLHHYLDQHPEISMSEPKELRLFLRSDWRDRIDWYERQFDGGAAVRGESSPGYSLYPARGDVASRIHSLIPDSRLIYLVRDPVDRVVSHWAQGRSDSLYRSFANSTPRRSFEETVRRADDPANPVIWGSRYATQVERYLLHFRESQFLIVDQAELKSDRRGTLSRVFEFLGVDPSFDSEAFADELNPRADKRELSSVGAPLWNYALWPLGRRLPARVRRPFAGPLKRLVHRPVSDLGALDPSIRRQLEEILRPEAARLRALTGQQFATWSV